MIYMYIYIYIYGISCLCNIYFTLVLYFLAKDPGPLPNWWPPARRRTAANLGLVVGREICYMDILFIKAFCCMYKFARFAAAAATFTSMSRSFSICIVVNVKVAEMCRRHGKFHLRV